LNKEVSLLIWAIGPALLCVDRRNVFLFESG